MVDFFVLGLMGLLKVGMYLFVGVMTLIFLFVATCGLIDGPKYRGKTLVEAGRIGLLAGFLFTLWGCALAFDATVSRGMLGFFDLIELAGEGSGPFYAFLMMVVVPLGAFTLWHIGAYLAPRHMRSAILNFDI